MGFCENLFAAGRTNGSVLVRLIPSGVNFGGITSNKSAVFCKMEKCCKNVSLKFYSRVVKHKFR